MPEGLRITAFHLWFPDIDRLAANEKDFSLTLEMTMRESLMSFSLLILSHQSLVIPTSRTLEDPEVVQTRDAKFTDMACLFEGDKAGLLALVLGNQDHIVFLEEVFFCDEGHHVLCIP